MATSTRFFSMPYGSYYVYSSGTDDEWKFQLSSNMCISRTDQVQTRSMLTVAQNPNGNFPYQINNDQGERLNFFIVDVSTPEAQSLFLPLLAPYFSSICNVKFLGCDRPYQLDRDMKGRSVCVKPVCDINELIDVPQEYAKAFPPGTKLRYSGDYDMKNNTCSYLDASGFQTFPIPIKATCPVGTVLNNQVRSGGIGCQSLIPTSNINDLQNMIVVLTDSVLTSLNLSPALAAFAINTATFTQDGRILLYQPQRNLYYSVVYQDFERIPSGLLYVANPKAINNGGVWRFQTVYGTGNELSLFNKDLFPYYPMSVKDLDIYKKSFNCSPGGSTVNMNDSQYYNSCEGECNTYATTCGSGDDYCRQRKKDCGQNDGMVNVMTTPATTHCSPRGDCHDSGGYNYCITNWSNVDNNDQMNKCASLDPTVVKNGKINYCKCVFNTVPIQVGDRQISLDNANDNRQALQNKIYAPWSSDTAKASVYQTFCGQHDSSSNSPLFASDNRCQAWCDQNPEQCAPVKDQYCSTYPTAKGCDQLCADNKLGCFQTFDKMCQGTSLTSEACQTWCNDPNVNCDDRLKAYCSTLTEDQLKDSNLCGCFRSDQFYQNFKDFLSQQVDLNLGPKPKKYIKKTFKSGMDFVTKCVLDPSGTVGTLTCEDCQDTDNPPECPKRPPAPLASCYFGMCANQNMKPYQQKQQGVQCPNIASCVTNLNYNNEGTIEGKVTIVQNNDCHFCPAGVSFNEATKRCEVPLTYDWRVGEWSSCQVDDHVSKVPGVYLGTVNRSVTCYASDGTVAGDDKCTMLKPVTSTNCSYKSTYVPGEWEACSVDGKQSRTVKCIDQFNKEVDSKYCDLLPVPPSSQDCSYPYKYSVGDWTSCTVDGKQTRVVKCVDSKLPSSQVSDSLCAGPKPTVEQSCVPPVTYSFVTGEWSPCTSAGTQTRTVACKDDKGNVVSDGLCKMTKPSSIQTCTPPVTYSYVTGQWSACNSDYIQNRSVVCMDSNGNHVEDSMCKGTKPDESQDCVTYQYSVSDWNDCKDGQQTRLLTCLNSKDKSKVDLKLCDSLEKPILVQTCTKRSISPLVIITIVVAVALLVIFFKRR